MNQSYSTTTPEGKRQVIDAYRRAVKSNPKLSLKSFCDKIGLGDGYKHVLWWANGQDIRRKGRGTMFSLESNVRYFMYQHPVSMRKGIDSLFNLVISESPMSPMTGDVFVFFSKNRQSVKLLKWDTDGYYELSWETFNFIMSGVSLDSVCFRKQVANLESLLKDRDESHLPSQAIRETDHCIAKDRRAEG